MGRWAEHRSFHSHLSEGEQSPDWSFMEESFLTELYVDAQWIKLIRNEVPKGKAEQGRGGLFSHATQGMSGCCRSLPETT